MWAENLAHMKKERIAQINSVGKCKGKEPRRRYRHEREGEC